MEYVYLDNNATAPISPPVREAIKNYMNNAGANPMSPHAGGFAARKWLESARLTVADAINAEDRQLFFTGSGTESNATALHTAVPLATDKRNVVVTSEIEHASVLRNCDLLRHHGIEVRFLPVRHDGRIDTSHLEQFIDDRCLFVSVQFVNNETGVIQPVSEILSYAKAVGAFTHIDAAQALGRVQVDVDSLEVDFMTITGHKIHAPSGIGALYARRPAVVAPLIVGGDQESSLRAGTHNVIGAVGFGAAATERFEHFYEHVSHLSDCRDRFEQTLKVNIPKVVVVGATADRVCNTSNIVFPDIEDGQAFYARLVDAGIACSQSSACHSRRPEPSHVLSAMGYSEDESYRAIRFSFGVQNSHDQAMRAAEVIAEVWNATAHKPESVAEAFEGVHA